MLLTSKRVRGLPAALGWVLVLSWGVTLGGDALAQAAAGATSAHSARVDATQATPAATLPAPLTLQEGQALAKARACLGCHQMDNKRVGPSFRAIAQRYADKSDAVSHLIQVIQKGGRGQWGAVPMPGQSVNNQDAEKLAQWIVSLRKE